MSAVRVFTLDEANRTLPYVRRVVDDLVRDYREWQEAVARLEVLGANRRAADGDMGPARADERSDLEARVARLARQIEGYLREITAVGAEVKGFADGLIDFPGERDGRAIRWCWKLGEDRVSHWHDIDAGFAGRQSVSELEPIRRA